jgi:hypothetical protein
MTTTCALAGALLVSEAQPDSADKEPKAKPV